MHHRGTEGTEGDRQEARGEARTGPPAGRWGVFAAVSDQSQSLTLPGLSLTLGGQSLTLEIRALAPAGRGQTRPRVWPTPAGEHLAPARKPLMLPLALLTLAGP